MCRVCGEGSVRGGVARFYSLFLGVSAGVCWEGSVRGGVARPLEGGERRRQDLLQQGREVLVQGVRDLPDRHAQVQTVVVVAFVAVIFIIIVFVVNVIFLVVIVVVLVVVVVFVVVVVVDFVVAVVVVVAVHVVVDVYVVVVVVAAVASLTPYIGCSVYVDFIASIHGTWEGLVHFDFIQSLKLLDLNILLKTFECSQFHYSLQLLSVHVIVHFFLKGKKQQLIF